MAKRIIKDIGPALFAELDLTCETNSVTINASAEAVDLTTLCATAMQRSGGILDGNVTYGGFTDHFSQVESVGSKAPFAMVMGSTPSSDVSAGTLAFFGDSVNTSAETGGNHGEAQSYQLTLPCNGPLVRGKLLQDSRNTAVTTASDGSEVQLSTVTAAQSLYASIHLIAFTGTDITFKVQSDATGFASPTDRITFTQLTAAGSESKSSLGPITPDDYFRVSWTGTFSSAAFVCVAGVF